MTNQLMTIDNVRGYLDSDGIVQLNLDDVARGLGFVQTKNKVEYVRWETVLNYLDEFGFSQQAGKENFIPENIFYKLCFKAKNKIATVFQNKVTDDILPAIRKTGSYTLDEQPKERFEIPKSYVEALRLAADQVEQNEKLKIEIEANAPLVLFAESVSASKDSILIGELSKVLNQNGVDIGRNRLFAWLKENGYLMKSGEEKNQPTQYSMKLKLFEIKKRDYKDSLGNIKIATTTKVTAKGVIYFVNRFLKNQGTRRLES